MTARPLALSLGDPAGVGPEIVVKAWRALRGEGPAFFVVGDAASLSSAPLADGVPIRRISAASEAGDVFADAIPVLDLPVGAPVTPGQPSGAYAAAVIAWIETGAALALSGQAAGLVTAPIAKAPLYASGFRFPGHTEFLGELTHARAEDGPVMMLMAGDLRTTLVTIHEPLAAVAALVTREKIVRTALITARALQRDFGVAQPRVAVAALNPHGGETGALGRQEIEVIAPACEELRALGVDVSGPRPSDTLFHPEARAAYDAVVCMYHDQALIPVKLLDFWGGVNVTLGLPIVRTSPDHGVGWDIAGKGVARPESLIAAIRTACEIAARRAA